MNRSQTKCLLASSGGHVLLFLIFAFGSAFLARKPDPDSLPKLKFVPSILIDEMLAGGGGNPKLPQDDSEAAAGSSPAVVTPPPPPPVATPVAPPSDPVVTPPPVDPVEPPKAEKPEKVEKIETPVPVKPRPSPTKRTEPKPVVKADKPKVETETAEPSKTPVKKPQPDIDLSRVVTRNNEDAKRKQREAEKRAQEEADRRAQEEAFNRAKAAQEQRNAAIQSSLQSLGTGFSTDKGVKIDVGGPGGAAYGNYALVVKKRYESAWRISSTLNEDDKTAEISVTILRNGTVLNARVTRRSGLSAMDRSIENLIRDVKQLPPFPESARDEQRTFVIEFNLQAKRRSG